MEQSVIDNYVFTAGNLEILAQGRQNDVPTITGTNAHEYGAPNNPKVAGLPHWPSVGEKPGFTMEVGDKFAPIPIAQDKQKQAFMEKYLTATASVGSGERRTIACGESLLALRVATRNASTSL